MVKVNEQLQQDFADLQDDLRAVGVGSWTPDSVYDALSVWDDIRNQVKETEVARLPSRGAWPPATDFGETLQDMLVRAGGEFTFNLEEGICTEAEGRFVKALLASEDTSSDTYRPPVIVESHRGIDAVLKTNGEATLLALGSRSLTSGGLYGLEGIKARVIRSAAKQIGGGPIIIDADSLDEYAGSPIPRRLTTFALGQKCLQNIASLLDCRDIVGTDELRTAAEQLAEDHYTAAIDRGDRLMEMAQGTEYLDIDDD